MSQGDIEKRTGLLRCYLSRVENGHTVPSLETIEKVVAALEIPLYQFFYEGTKSPEIPESIFRVKSKTNPRDRSSMDEKSLRRLRAFLAKMKDSDIQTLLALANKMAKRN